MKLVFEKLGWVFKSVELALSHPDTACALIFILFFANSCARETTIDLPQEDPKTVVICHFQPGKPFKMTLSRSQPVFDSSEPTEITSGDVSIAEDDRFYSRLNYLYDQELERWLWVSKKNAEAERSYILTIRLPIPNEPIVQAVSSTPRFFPLEKITMDTANTRVVTLPDGSSALRVPLELLVSQLPPTQRYFAFSIRHETHAYKTENGQQVIDYSYSTRSSFTANGRTLSLLNDVSSAEPVVLVNENFWSDDSRVLRLDAIIPHLPVRERPFRLFLEWRTLSEEFYRYHLSVSRQSSNQPLNDPDAVFNNVLNGYGSFSGFSVQVDTLALPKI